MAVVGVGAVLVVAGALIAVFAPGKPILVPSAGGVTGRAPALRYAKAFPEPGDAPLVRPVGVDVGGSRLYVADSQAGVVRVFSTFGPEAGEIGTGTLAVPTYVAYEATSATLLVSDREAGRLWRFERDGTLVGEVRPSSEPTAAWEPLGVAVDADRIAVTDASNRQRVVVMDSAGDMLFVIGAAGAQSAGTVGVALDYPNSVGFVGDRIWVGDSNNRRVLIFAADGALLGLVRLDGVARGLAFIPGDEKDPGWVAVVDPLSSEIVLLDLDGAEVVRFGGAGTAPGRLAYPNDVAYDAEAGILYVADTGNERVQAWEVLSPDEAARAAGTGGGPPLAAGQLAGILVAVLGAVAAAMALLWRRQA